MVMNGFKSWALLTAALLTTGCVFRAAPVYEETYRVFYGTESFYDIDPDATSDEIARKFAPTATLNRSIDELAREGYVLYEMEPLAGRDRPTLLRFRRLIENGRRPTTAPAEYLGVYATDDGAYYILTPYRLGYFVHLLNPGSRDQIVKAKWDGKRLRWQEGEFENGIELSPDARTLTLTVDTTELEDFPTPRAVITARRVNNLN